MFTNHALNRLWHRAFTLLETLVMLVVLVVFSLLLAGITKRYWGADQGSHKQPDAISPPAMPSR